jgi:hypothetical protein
MAEIVYGTVNFWMQWYVEEMKQNEFSIVVQLLLLLVIIKLRKYLTFQCHEIY